MRNILLIARREYIEQIRSRAFKLSTIGLPAVLGAVLCVTYFSTLGMGGHKHMALASSDAELANAVRARLLMSKHSKAVIDVVAPATPQDRATLVEKVRTRAIDGVLWIDTSTAGMPTATYTSRSSGDFMTAARLKDAMSDGLVDEKLSGSGMKQSDVDDLLKGVSITTFQVRTDGQLVKSNAEASFWKGYVMALLLTMTTMIYGLNVARSIIQEKTSRVFEVLLATVKPGDMLAGKLIGAGAVGLTQIGIWLVAGAVDSCFTIRRCRTYRPIRHPLLVGGVRSLSGLLFAWIPALQFAFCWSGRHVRNRAGTAHVYAAGRRAHLAQLCHDSAHHQRLQLILVGSGFALPTHRAYRHVFAHGFADSAGMAVCGLNRPDDL